MKQGNGTGLDGRTREADVAAYERMRAARPLKPPPYNFERLRPTAASRALQADRRAGLWER